MALKPTDQMSVLIDQSGGRQEYHTIADINTTVSAEEDARLTIQENMHRTGTLAPGIIASIGTIFIDTASTPKIYIAIDDSTGAEEDLAKWAQISTV